MSDEGPVTDRGSYRVETFATSVEAEIRRLNAQVDLFWPSERVLLQRYGLQDGMKVLDCGCGPGRLIELLRGVLPSLVCTGLEMDPLLVSAASQRLTECGLGDCRVLQGTAEQPGLPEESVDFVILRLVLEHVPDPLRALQSLARLLKPGGRLFVIANDFEFHLRAWPAVPELDRLYEAYCASRSSEGGDPCIGRRLPHLLRRAGLASVGYEIEVAHNEVVGDAAFLKAEGAGIPAQLVRTGFLDERVLESMTRSWRAMLAEPGHCIVRPLFVCVGERRRETGDVADRVSAVGGTPDSPSAEASPRARGGVAGDVSALVLLLVAEALGRKQVEPGHLLADLGMDSLAAMNLQERIKVRTGVEIPIVQLLENVPVRRLIEAVAAQLATGQGRPHPPEPCPGPREPGRWEEGEI
jgi:ubiquinone/menaquinone biosynthesis C-methylase UbiE/aryl carrier-like protein